MKVQHLFFALTLSITSFAALKPSQQDEPLAEQVYKNIKSMKGMPASEVIPAMKFMGASLKVDCDFCHGDDYASDEKGAKIETRHMIEMQKEINTKNFKGKLEVTCFTCHNGSPSVAHGPSLASMSRRTIERGGTPVVAADVIKKALAGVGGELKAVTLTGTAKGFGPDSPLTITQGAPNKFLNVFGGRRYAFDGTVTWIESDGKAAALPADQAKQVQSFGRFFRSEQAFASVGNLRFVGRDKINGKDVVVLRVGAQSAKVTEDFYFDATTGLLTRIGTYTSTFLGNLPAQTDFSDYRKVGEAMVPFKMTHNDGSQLYEFLIDKAVANPTLAADFFSLPKGGTTK